MEEFCEILITEVELVVNKLWLISVIKGFA